MTHGLREGVDPLHHWWKGEFWHPTRLPRMTPWRWEGTWSLLPTQPPQTLQWGDRRSFFQCPKCELSTRPLLIPTQQGAGRRPCKLPNGRWDSPPGLQWHYLRRGRGAGRLITAQQRCKSLQWTFLVIGLEVWAPNSVSADGDGVTFSTLCFVSTAVTVSFLTC